MKIVYLDKNEKAPKRSDIGRRNIGSIFIGVGVGSALFSYVGYLLIFPICLFFIFKKISKKYLKFQNSGFEISFSMQASQLFWVVISLFLVSILSKEVIFSWDIIFIFGSLMWFVLKRSEISVIFLSLCQFFVFIINLTEFSSVEIGSVQHKALLVHLIFRVLAIISLWIGMRDFLKSKDR